MALRFKALVICLTVLTASSCTTMIPLTNVAPDRVVRIEGDEAMSAMRQATWPAEEQARATYPAARQRYLDGLPARQTFYVTTWLHDNGGRSENAFILVDRIKAGRIRGRLATDLTVVMGYKPGQSVELSEADIVDWTILSADGTEEGNYVGKFSDRLQAEWDTLPAQQPPR